MFFVFFQTSLPCPVPGAFSNSKSGKEVKNKCEKGLVITHHLLGATELSLAPWNSPYSTLSIHIFKPWFYEKVKNINKSMYFAYKPVLEALNKLRSLRSGRIYLGIQDSRIEGSVGAIGCPFRPGQGSSMLLLLYV